MNSQLDRNSFFQRCFAVLNNCEEFGTDTRIRGFFGTAGLPLDTYTQRIKNADDPMDRVRSTVFLLSNESRGPGLPLVAELLRNLRDKRTARNAEYAELNGLFAELQADRQLVDAYPVVIAAMNRAEADDLFAERVFDDPSVAASDRTRFREFSNALTQDKLDVLQFYDDTRDTWHPYEMGPVRDIVTELLKKVSSIRGRNQRPLAPEFLSEDFFSFDRNAVLRARESIKLGGILIVDIVSLFHPRLAEVLNKSAIQGSDKLSVFMISPMSPSLFTVSTYLEKVIADRLEVAFDRFNRSYDRRCDVGLSDTRALQRWINSVMIGQNVETPDDGGVKQFGQQHNIQEVGYGSFLSTGLQR